jgi:hypothetical protein
VLLVAVDPSREGHEQQQGGEIGSRPISPSPAALTVTTPPQPLPLAVAQRQPAHGRGEGAPPPSAFRPPALPGRFLTLPVTEANVTATVSSSGPRSR